jgi:hypothetical protein
MRGSITLNAPSYRPALIGSGSQGMSLLAALSGKSSLESVTATGNVESEPGQTNAAWPIRFTGAEPQFKRDIAQFTLAVAAASTPAQLLARPVALRVLLTAHGLADQFGNSALATRALLSNPARSNSLLNQLKDPRWFAVNSLYSFATQGLAELRKPEIFAAICRAYAEALRMTSLEQSPPTHSNALTFPEGAALSELTAETAVLAEV